MAAAYEEATTSIRGRPSVSTNAACDRNRPVVPWTSKPRKGMIAGAARGSGRGRSGEGQCEGRQDGHREKKAGGAVAATRGPQFCRFWMADVATTGVGGGGVDGAPWRRWDSRTAQAPD